MKRWFLYSLGLPLFMACSPAPVIVRSNVDPQNHKTFNRILISFKSEEKTKELFSKVETDLDAELARDGVASKNFLEKDNSESDLSLGNGGIEAAEKEYAPDGVLYLWAARVSWRSGPYAPTGIDTVIIKGTFEDRGRGRTIWKASVLVLPTETTFYDEDKTAEKIAYYVLRQMQLDYLIR